MAWTRWTLFDPTTSSTVTLAINPSDGGDRSYEKTITTTATSAPAAEGRTLLAEGRDKPGDITFRGVFLNTSHRNTLIALFEKRTQLKLTNDYGEQYWIYIDKLNITRKRVASRPYKGDYEAHAFVLDIPA